MTDTKASDEVPDNHEAPAATSEFEQLPPHHQMSLMAEFWLFIKEEKKWWLTPIILVLLGVGGLVYLTSTGAAPFIYTLF
jgi:hypothetical protein